MNAIRRPARTLWSKVPHHHWTHVAALVRRTAESFRSIWAAGLETYVDRSRGAASLNLLRYFSIASLAVLVPITAIGILAFQSNQSAMLLSVAERQNESLARSFANTVWSSHAKYLSSVGHLDGDALRARPETGELDRELRTVTRGLPVLKVKIFAMNGQTIYSSELTQIGESKGGNPGFRKALHTNAPVSKMSYRGSFSAFSGIVAQVDLAETYVPIFDEAGVVKSVFELYTDISPHVARTRQAIFVAMALLFLAAIIVYLALLMVVRLADDRIKSQHDALIAFTGKLETANVTTAKLNVDLREKIIQLERSNQDLQEFAHVASHDLQEPLRRIEAFGERLASTHAALLPKDGRLFLERMQDSSRRMRRLITDLLSYSKVTRNARPFSQVRLSDVMKDVLSDLQVPIEETQAAIRVGHLPTIDADEIQMRQLLHSLVSNALKFRKAGAKPIVEIQGTILGGGSTEEAARLVLTVADNGIGIDAKHQELIFKLFQRLHTQRDFDGTGVGLATCRRIAEYHRGSISVDSSPDGGACFRYVAPVLQAVAA